jgi:DNA-binding beta-propeller fold protein YncE
MPATKELLVIDAATRKEAGRMKLDGVPLGLAFSADGKTAFVTAVEPDAVLKIDLAKMAITGSADPGKGPDGVAVFGF